MSANQSDGPGASIQVKQPTATIEAVATNTAGFLGESTTGPTLEPILITSFAAFAGTFGDLSTSSGQLAHAVHGFFNNGGARCFVVSVGAPAPDGDERDERFAAGLRCLDSNPDVALVVAPGVTAAKIQDAILAHCERRKDRFAILDCPDTGEATPSRPRVSTYGACYFPWIQVHDPERGTVHVPPSGHVAGIYARVDGERGVHVAPANEVIRGALGLRRNVSKQEQDALDGQGINCILTRQNAIRVWGARTLSSDPVFRDLQVRRLVIMVESSIERAISWAFVLPPERALWERVTRSVSSFLLLLHRNGALVGQSPEQAFQVTCDAATERAADAPADPVVIEVGLALLRPKDFVVFRVGGA